MIPTHSLAFVLAVFIGVSLGALGSGGSIVTLPVLVYIAHVEPDSAVAMSMAIVGVTSAIGAYLQSRRGNFHTKAALLFGVSGILGAYLGSSVTQLVSPSTLMLIFAALMLVVGAAMFRAPFRGAAGRQCHWAWCSGIGAIVGLLTGFLGVGGGFLLVPALVLLAGLDTKVAVGTSLAIIALNSASGLAGQLRYVMVDWRLTAGFIAFALLGMWAGVALAARLSEQNLRKAFATLLVAVALAIAELNL